MKPFIKNEIIWSEVKKQYIIDESEIDNVSKLILFIAIIDGSGREIGDSYLSLSEISNIEGKCYEVPIKFSQFNISISFNLITDIKIEKEPISNMVYSTPISYPLSSQVPLNEFAKFHCTRKAIFVINSAQHKAAFKRKTPNMFYIHKL